MKSSFFSGKQSIPEERSPTLMLGATSELMAKHVETLSNLPLSGAAIFGNCIQRVNRPDFDSDFKVSIDEQVRDIKGEFKSTCTDDPTGTCITFNNVCTSVISLKTKKACGHNGICNEHLINGGSCHYSLHIY